MPFPLQLKQFFIQGKCIELFVPDEAVVKESSGSGNINSLYWSQVWPAALALTEFLLIYPHYIHNKNVLELAAGLGLPSIAIAKNAAAIVCSDYIDEAVSVMQQSVLHNQLSNVSVLQLDWYFLPENLAANVLLLSDVSYDSLLFDVQQKVILQFLEKGTTVIISTPQRLMAKEALSPLLTYCTKQEEIAVTHNKKEVMTTVMVLGNRR